MRASLRIQVWSACLGNLFEHYDTALFGFLSPFLAPLIFPKHDPITALILTYAMIPLGMLARPIGSLVFGYLGDLYGRGYALFLTLGGMALVSSCIALSPTYSQAGIFAPMIFCLGRVLQNFFAAGETMGGAIFLLENSEEKRHDFLSSIYCVSTMSGHLLASLGVFLISLFQVVNPGWRFLYLFGCVTALFGCMLRRSSPAQGSLPRAPHLGQMFWSYRRQLLSIIICSGFASATYSIALVLMNGFIPLITTLTKTEVMRINTYLLILDVCALPCFGWLASRISREKLMLVTSFSALLLAPPLFLSLEGAFMATVVGIRMAFVLLGVAFFAPFHAWAQNLIPSHSRYGVISMGYAIGSQLLGSPTAAIALWTFHKTGVVASACWYWMALALASTAIIMMRSSKVLEERG